MPSRGRRYYLPILLIVVACACVAGGIILQEELHSSLNARLNEAKMHARTVATKSNLRQLCVAVFLFADSENNQVLPLHLAAVSPYLGTFEPLRDLRYDSHPSLIKPDPAADWRIYKAEVDAHCDFFYAGAGLNERQIKDPATTIILYDKGFAPNARLLAFADGHVESHPSAAEAKPLIDATNLARAAQHLPPLPPDLLSAPAPATSPTP